MEIGNIILGEPWSGDGTVVVPVIRKDPKQRNYVTVEEVKDQLDIKDTGSISKVEIKNKTDKPVFVRSGTMFEGKGTQSRMPTMSIVIMPQENPIPVEVNCIHASHPISLGSSFSVRESAPVSVLSAALSSPKEHRQSATWRAASNYTYSLSTGLSSATARTFTSDNLIRATTQFKEDLDKMINSMPIQVKNQVGIIVLDLDGIIGIEMFDSPESWLAVCKDVARRYAEKISKKMKETWFKLDKEKMKKTIGEFISQITQSKQTKMYEDGDAKTFSLDGENYVGEVVKIKEIVIYLIAVRKSKEEKRTPAPTGTFTTWTAPSNYTITPTYYRTDTTANTTANNYWVDTTTALGPKEISTLDAIGHGFSKWDTLIKKTNISPNTLSKHLKTFENQGLVARTPVIEGSRAMITYSLTGSGKKALFKC